MNSSLIKVVGIVFVATFFNLATYGQDMVEKVMSKKRIPLTLNMEAVKRDYPTTDKVALASPKSLPQVVHKDIKTYNIKQQKSWRMPNKVQPVYRHSSHFTNVKTIEIIKF